MNLEGPIRHCSEKLSPVDLVLISFIVDPFHLGQVGTIKKVKSRGRFMIQVPREEELHVLLEKNMTLISDSSTARAMSTAAGSADAMVNYRDLAAALVCRIVLPADRSKEPDAPEVPERAARVEKRING